MSNRSSKKRRIPFNDYAMYKLGMVPEQHKTVKNLFIENLQTTFISNSAATLKIDNKNTKNQEMYAQNSSKSFDKLNLASFADFRESEL